jgi:hypothetical protein
MATRQKRPAPPKRSRTQPPVYSVAPVATDDHVGLEMEVDKYPVEPPPRPRHAIEPPLFRPLRVFAFDPSLGRTPGNVMTIPVRYEKLQPGPVGGRVRVVDYDASRNCFYEPVDLDDPLIAIRGGLDPSESDPQFHQQMVYAVTCETLRRVESSVGRTVNRRTAAGSEPLSLVVYPHGTRSANAFALDDKLVFGYFRAFGTAMGRTIPGQTVFSCLSHDVVIHVAMQAIMDAIRPDLSDDADGSDVAALQQGLSDIAALLIRFSYRDAVLDTIQRTAGSIHRTWLEGGGTAVAPGSELIQAEVAVANPLLVLGSEFGDAMGMAGGLRSALGQKPDPKALQNITEPHERGGILVAAIFDAFFSTYVARSVDLFNIYRAGGGRLDGRDLPAPLADRLFAEVDAIAARVFNICIRALDYCPACTLGLGDFLRALITADYEYVPSDEWGVRDALMQAFRRRGIKPSGATFYSEDALRWPVVDSTRFKTPGPQFIGLPEPDASNTEHNQRLLVTFVTENTAALGLRPGVSFEVHPLEVARVAARDSDLRVSLFARVVQTRTTRGGARHQSGVSLVFDRTGRLRYAINSDQSQHDRKGPS